MTSFKLNVRSLIEKNKNKVGSKFYKDLSSSQKEHIEKSKYECQNGI